MNARINRARSVHRVVLFDLGLWLGLLADLRLINVPGHDGPALSNRIWRNGAQQLLSLFRMSCDFCSPHMKVVPDRQGDVAVAVEEGLRRH